MRLLLPLLLLLSTAACVSQQAYDTKAQQAQELATQSETLHQDLMACEQKQDKLARQLQQCRQAKLKQRQNYQKLQEKQQQLQEQQRQCQQQRQQLKAKLTQTQKKHNQCQQQLEKERIARKARMARIKNTYNSLVQELEQEIQQGQVRIKKLKNQLSLELVDRILFDSGQAQLNTQGQDILQRLKPKLQQLLNQGSKILRVAGHTDNVPISARLRSRFASNWELSTARALEVLHFLQQEGIAGKHLVACGFGPYQPVADNSTAQGRRRNRRIQLLLTPPPPRP